MRPEQLYDQITQAESSFNIINIILAEYIEASQSFDDFNSMHEGYAVLKEEVDELWDAIKVNEHDAALGEAVQVAAMSLRFIMDLAPAVTGKDISK